MRLAAWSSTTQILGCSNIKPFSVEDEGFRALAAPDESTAMSKRGLTATFAFLQYSEDFYRRKSFFRSFLLSAQDYLPSMAPKKIFPMTGITINPKYRKIYFSFSGGETKL